MQQYFVINYGGQEIKQEWKGLIVIQQSLLDRSYGFFQEHKQAWKVQSVRPKKDVSWSPPPSNWIKMNFDAAIREEKTTMAVVSRDFMVNTLKA